MANKKKIKLKSTPSVSFLTNLNLGFKKEYFLLSAFSGNKVFRFGLTPKHAKRAMLLLQKQIKKYEKKFGELETSLPEKGKTSGSRDQNRSLGFMRAEE